VCLTDQLCFIETLKTQWDEFYQGSFSQSGLHHEPVQPDGV